MDADAERIPFMKTILIFGGTTEGRLLTEAAAENRNEAVRTISFVATDYGEARLTDRETDRVSVRCGRLDADGMRAAIREAEGECFVYDATHPYAVLVSQNLKSACLSTGARYRRILRDSGADVGTAADKDTGMTGASRPTVLYTESETAAVRLLKDIPGQILITTGTKCLEAYAELPDHEKRCSVRALPTADAIEKCRRLGFRPEKLMLMQGPFSEEMNVACIHRAQADILVTKASGQTGGFPEKLKAAEQTGVKVIVVRRPEETGTADEGLSLKLAIEEIRKLCYKK